MISCVLKLWMLCAAHCAWDIDFWHDMGCNNPRHDLARTFGRSVFAFTPCSLAGAVEEFLFHIATTF